MATGSDVVVASASASASASLPALDAAALRILPAPPSPPAVHVAVASFGKLKVLVTWGGGRSAAGGGGDGGGGRSSGRAQRGDPVAEDDARVLDVFLGASEASFLSLLDRLPPSSGLPFRFPDTRLHDVVSDAGLHLVLAAATRQAAAKSVFVALSRPWELPSLIRYAWDALVAIRLAERERDLGRVVDDDDDDEDDDNDDEEAEGARGE